MNATHKPIIALIALFSFVATNAQQTPKEYVQKHQVPIASIHPDSLEFSDLEPLGKAIGDARFVFLGEQDHGDAPTFLAKTRLIKYLHEKKGFNVLAFESDFYGINEGWKWVNKSSPDLDSFLKHNIYPIWTYCASCSDLFYRYLPATQKTLRPMAVAGFDCQNKSRYAIRELPRRVDSLCKALQLPVTAEVDYAATYTMIDTLCRLYGHVKVTPDFLSRCRGKLQVIYGQLLQKLPPDDFWAMMVKNLVQEADEYDQFERDKRDVMDIRDAQMADNIRWLASHTYKNEKMIIWAANLHVSRFLSGSKGRTWAFMGEYFTRDSLLRKSSYILGFASSQGKAGRLGFTHFTVQKPKGFEKWMHPEWPYAFIDMKAMPDKNEAFFLKGFGHNNFKSAWAKWFDGLFYIRDMYPCAWQTW